MEPFVDLAQGIRIIKLDHTLVAFLNFLMRALTETECGVQGFYKSCGVLTHGPSLESVPVQLL
jgi:hypothetical protein